MSSQHTQLRLSEVSEVIRGVSFGASDGISTPADGYLPVLRAGNIQDSLETDKDLVWVPKGKIKPKQRILKNDIVMCASSGSASIVGKTARATEDWNGSFGAFCVGIRADCKRCDPGFLYHYLNSPMFRRWTGRSSGANIKNIRKTELEEFEFPDVALSEQKRIAAILDKADAIRRKRQHAIQLADEFLRSVFLEMFGDPQQAGSRYPKKPIKWFGRVVTGNTPSRQDPDNFGDAVEWIKSDNINTPSHFLTKATEGLSVKGVKLGRVVPSGSILTTCIAGSKDCIGNLAIADRDVAFNQQINALVPNDHVDLGFLYSQLLVAKTLVQKASTNSMKGMVSKSNYEQIELLAPPEDDQRKFGVIFEKYLKLADRLKNDGSNAAELFASLSQRAFQGGL